MGIHDGDELPTRGHDVRVQQYLRRRLAVHERRAVDAVEDPRIKGLYGLGDVKTKTKRYPIKKVQELCGPNPGDWCLLSTKLDDGFKVYAIGHRRGGVVHTFVSTCGLVTVPGVPQAHQEDMGVYGNMEARPCPKVLNTWSQQQPKIDSNYRYRQDILAIEERFTTQSFPFRMMTTIIMTIIGITFANAYMYEWFGYFVDNKKYMYDSSQAFMRDLSYDAMHNTFDEDSRAQTQTPAPDRRPHGAPSPVRASPRSIEKAHLPVPIKSLPGYKGHGKAKCAVCNDNKHKTTWCCHSCSTATAIFGMHPAKVTYGGKQVTYDCLITTTPTTRTTSPTAASPPGGSASASGGSKPKKETATTTTTTKKKTTTTTTTIPDLPFACARDASLGGRGHRSTRARAEGAQTTGLMCGDRPASLLVRADRGGRRVRALGAASAMPVTRDSYCHRYDFC